MQNKFGYFLEYLARMSVLFADRDNATNGRPVYPYKLATTREERMAHVRRRQSNNSGGGRSRKAKLAAVSRNGLGVSRKYIVDRTD